MKKDRRKREKLKRAEERERDIWPPQGTLKFIFGATTGGRLVGFCGLSPLSRSTRKNFRNLSRGTGSSVGLRIINSPSTTIRILAYFTIDEAREEDGGTYRKREKTNSVRTLIIRAIILVVLKTYRATRYSSPCLIKSSLSFERTDRFDAA